MSDWKRTAVERRDERNIKGPEINKPSPAKKNTKKWCKGKVGREHKTRVMDGEEKGSFVQRNDSSKFVIMQKWRYLICTVCGKELDIYYGIGEKPEWAK